MQQQLESKRILNRCRYRQKKKGSLCFALQNKVIPSFFDGIGNGLGYAWILIVVAFFRELLGNGTLLGMTIIPASAYELGYANNGMMTMPAMALILVGCVIWAHSSISNNK